MKLKASIAAIAVGLGLTKLAGDFASVRYEDLDLRDATPPGKTVAINGLRLHYEEAGSGDPVVFLHGLGASTFSFRKNLDVAGRGFHAVAIDMPGHGYSSRDVADLSLSAQTGYLRVFLDALGIDRASLVGHSMGGTVAQRFALAYPDRVRRLVLIASTTDRQMRSGSKPGRVVAPFLPALLGAVFFNPALRDFWHRAAVVDPGHLTPEVLAGYARPGHIRGHMDAYKRFLVDRTRDGPIDAARIRAPTLVLWGARDRLVPLRTADELARLIPDSRLRVIPRAGHWVQEEQPEEVNSALLEFLREP